MSYHESRYKSICPDYKNAEGYFEGVEFDSSWSLHHRLGEICSREVLEEMGHYYNRPACELIWIHQSEHMAIHMRLCNKGKHNSIRTEFKAGESSWNAGIPMREESKQKLRKCNLGKHHSEETRMKMSLTHKNEVNSGRFKKGQKAPNRSAWRDYFEQYKLNGGKWTEITFKKYFTTWFTNY